MARRGTRGKGRKIKAQKKQRSINTPPDEHFSYDSSGSEITPLRPEEYREKVELTLRRLNEGDGLKLLGILAGAAGLSIIAVVAGLALSVFFERAVFFLLLGLTALTLSAGCVVVEYLQLHKTPSLACPHCHADIDLQYQWECGDCGKKHNLQSTVIDEFLYAIKQRDRVTEMAHLECNACWESPHSLLCPACFNEIVLDEEEWREMSDTRDGPGRQGTARGLMEIDDTYPKLKDFFAEKKVPLFVCGIVCLVIGSIMAG